MNVVEETDTIEILNVDSLALELQAIRRTRELCPLLVIGRICERVELERRGDVDPASTCSAELIDGLSKPPSGASIDP